MIGTAADNTTKHYVKHYECGTTTITDVGPTDCRGTQFDPLDEPFHIYATGSFEDVPIDPQWLWEERLTCKNGWHNPRKTPLQLTQTKKRFDRRIRNCLPYKIRKD